MAWAEFTIALLLFFVSHALPARPVIRAALTTAVVERDFFDRLEPPLANHIGLAHHRRGSRALHCFVAF
jgi:hypothetical protein